MIGVGSVSVFGWWLWPPFFLAATAKQKLSAGEFYRVWNGAAAGVGRLGQLNCIVLLCLFMVIAFMALPAPFSLDAL